jgi:hypothetical protein
LSGPAPGILANDVDPDGGSLALELVTGPVNGSLVVNADGSFTYVPVANFHGADGFVYRVSDGLAFSNFASVTILVESVNDAPIATNDAYAVDEDTLLDVPAPGVLENDVDVDGDLIAASLVSGPAHGTLTLSPNGGFTYAPEVNFSGEDAFTYVAGDALSASNVATVVITVQAVNDPPTADAGPDQIVTDADGNGSEAVTLAGSGTDSDGTITFRWLEETTVLAESPTPTLTLAVGTHMLTLEVTDDGGASAVDQVVITVNAGGGGELVTIAHEGFESGGFFGGTGWTGGWSRAGDTANVSSGAPHRGFRHARERATGRIERVVDLAGATDARLRVWLKGNSFEFGERVLVRVRSGNGAFRTLLTFTRSNANNTYRFFELDLSSFDTTVPLTIRFEAQLGSTDDNFYIDDVDVIGVR